jgi:hypothetical protein
MPLFGCPRLKYSTRRPTAKELFNARLAMSRDEEARRRDVRRELQLNCEQPRAVAERQVSRSSQIQCEATERPASPAAHSTYLEAVSADDINALRGRVHAVVRLPMIKTRNARPNASKGIIHARLAVSRVSAARRYGREM